MAIYIPSAKNNDVGTVLAFGTISGSRVTKTAVLENSDIENVPHAPSVNKAYSAGSLDADGNYVILAPNQSTINGLANSQAGVIGLKPADRSADYNRGTKVQIVSIDRLSNTITYSNDSYDRYDYVSTSDGATAATDNPTAAANEPWDVAPNLTYLKDNGPATTTWGTL